MSLSIFSPRVKDWHLLFIDREISNDELIERCKPGRTIVNYHADSWGWVDKPEPKVNLN